MWSIIESEHISKNIVIDLFDGVETDLEEKLHIKSKKDLFEDLENSKNLRSTIAQTV